MIFFSASIFLEDSIIINYKEFAHLSLSFFFQFNDVKKPREIDIAIRSSTVLEDYWSHLMTSFVHKYPRYRSIAVNWHRAIIVLSLPFTVSRLLYYYFRLLQKLPSARDISAREPIRAARHRTARTYNTL